MGVLKQGGKCARPASCEVCPVDVAELLGEDATRCAFCGQLAQAYWRGERVVGCCDLCATAILPKLAADALVGPQGAHRTIIARLREAERRAKAAFWEAAACAIANAVPPLVPPRRCPYADDVPTPGRNGKPERN